MKQLKKPLIITLTSLIGVAILDLTLLIFVPSVRAMFTGYEYDVYPTCTEDGYRYYHSPDGNEYPIGRYLATGHDYIAAVTNPTCTAEGYTTYTCSHCHERYTANATSPTGHTYIDTITLPTCTAPGYTTHVCSTCGYTFRDSVTDPTGHSYSYKVTPATCTAEGYTTYTCTTCAHTYRDNTVAALGHNFQATTVSPTCTEAGSTSNTCTRCGLKTETTILPATGHRYSLTKKDPTCTTEGYTLHTCSACGDSFKTDTVRALGHVYTAAIHYATKTKAGGTTHTCSRCGDTYESDTFTYSTVFNSKQGDGKGEIARGVDLSYHNGTVDFVALKNSGISFVILRVGTTNGKDSKFEEYYTAAKSAGLDIGAYLYSYATTATAAAADANRTISWLGTKTFEYPIFLDIEHDSQKNLSKTTLTNIVMTYCDTLVENGFYPGLYTNKTWMEKINMTTVKARYDVWLASWIVTGAGITDYSSDYSLWQYSATGTVPGVSTDVDLDIVFRDYPSYIKKYGYNNFQ